MKQPQTHKTSYAFTLAELLIALAILGVIATFTIPKVLQAQQDERFNAIAKEAAATISSAYQQHQLRGLLSSNTEAKDLTQYMNYVTVITTGKIDDRPNNGGFRNCAAAPGCIVLHNGAVFAPTSGESFGGSNVTNYIGYTIDPDGTYSGREDSLLFLLYYNGKLVSRNDALPGSASNHVNIGPITNGDPSWFHWN